MPSGIRVRHTGGLSSAMYLVPVLKKPIAGGTDCRMCMSVHPVKTVHLWLEDDGGVIVSPGVLDDLRLAGMPQLEIANEVKKPPPLRIGGMVTDARDRRNWRFGQDKKNRATNLWYRRLTK